MALLLTVATTTSFAAITDENKVMKEKEENAGTTKGNPIQPPEPESPPPVAN